MRARRREFRQFRLSSSSCSFDYLFFLPPCSSLVRGEARRSVCLLLCVSLLRVKFRSTSVCLPNTSGSFTIYTYTFFFLVEDPRGVHALRSSAPRRYRAFKPTHRAPRRAYLSFPSRQNSAFTEAGRGIQLRSTHTPGPTAAMFSDRLAPAAFFPP